MAYDEEDEALIGRIYTRLRQSQEVDMRSSQLTPEEEKTSTTEIEMREEVKSNGPEIEAQEMSIPEDVEEKAKSLLYRDSPLPNIPQRPTGKSKPLQEGAKIGSVVKENRQLRENLSEEHNDRFSKFCEVCQYQAASKEQMQAHLKTPKHIELASREGAPVEFGLRALEGAEKAKEVSIERESGEDAFSNFVEDMPSVSDGATDRDTMLVVEEGGGSGSGDENKTTHDALGLRLFKQLTTEGYLTTESTNYFSTLPSPPMSSPSDGSHQVVAEALDSGDTPSEAVWGSALSSLGMHIA